MDELFLTDAEWDLLTAEEQDRYLALLSAEQSEWRMQPKQQKAYDTAEVVDDLLFGGQAGPGKSELLLYRAWRKSVEIPGHKTLVIRTTIPELKRTLILRSAQMFDRKQARWRATDKVWEFRNGSRIQFGHCETDDDVSIYLSDEYDMLLVDELTELTEYQFKMLLSRVRTTRTKRQLGARPHSVSASNPGQRGHQWVKEYFVDSTNYGQRAVEQPITNWRGEPVVDPDTGEQLRRRVAFIPAALSDNVYLDRASYIANLALLPEREQRMYLYGDWSVGVGAYFSDFDRIVHCFHPFPIPETWVRIVGIDYGSTNPFCALWGAIDWDGRLWVYREAYEKGLTPTEQAELILRLSEHEKLRNVYIDPSTFAKHTGGKGRSIADQMRRAGLKVQPAWNDRIAGWALIRQMLRNNPAGPNWGREYRTQHIPDGTQLPPGSPQLLISTACTNLLRTLPNLPHDRNNPEDIDTHTEDHPADALRYQLTGHARKTHRRKPKPPLRTADRKDNTP